MRRILIIFYCMAILPVGGAAVSPVFAADIKIDMKDIPRSVSQYEKFEASVNIQAAQEDPFDREKIDVTAHIKTPRGLNVSVPAFYTSVDRIWQIRYTPVEIGVYDISVSVSTGGRTAKSESKRFKALKGKTDGFLRISRDNGRYLMFDSGKSFFGVGHNLAWVTNNNGSTYKDYFKLMKANGCNLTRLWINMPWTIRIEGPRLGQFDTAQSRKLDEVISAAKENGIYIILVMDSYSSLMQERGYWDEQSWSTNPYNVTNGGMCETPLSIFTLPEAVRRYKNRVRYMIARWGYSPNIAAFELWNEMDAPADWTREIASYIKSLNPHGQLITTSVGYPWDNRFDESKIWELPGIDLPDKHIYEDTINDSTDHIINLAAEMSSRYAKPLLLGEFGMHSSRGDAGMDPDGKGIALHKSIWASMSGGCMASALNWWWSEYVKSKNMYPHYAALRRFTEGIDWARGKTRALDISSVTIPDMAGSHSGDIVIRTVDAWLDASYSDFTISNSGRVTGGFINRYLQSSAKMDRAIEPVFHVNFPQYGKMILNIDMVSQGSCLVVSLDGNEILMKELTAGPGCGPWKRSLYRNDHKIYQCVYDLDLEIDVPKGEHTVKLSNRGMDWLSIKTVTLRNYRSSSVANIYYSGTMIGDSAVLWLCNRDYGWKNGGKDVEPESIKGARAALNGIGAGHYSVEWWDTFAGRVIATDTVEVEADQGKLYLPVPSFSKDIACKIKKRSAK